MLNTPIENKASNVSSYDVYKLTRVIIANTPSTIYNVLNTSYQKELMNFR